MKEIKLTQGKIALVDDEDFEYLNQWSWQAMKTKYGFRVKRTVLMPNGVKHTVYMHRDILKVDNKSQIDHWDTNSLNNQKYNLRTCTGSQNRANTIKNEGCYSKYKGVTWNKRAKKWIAQLTFQYNHINLGYFKTEEDAALAYDAKAKELWGDYSRLNFQK